MHCPAMGNPEGVGSMMMKSAELAATRPNLRQTPLRSGKMTSAATGRRASDINFPPSLNADTLPLTSASGFAPDQSRGGARKLGRR
jgi:hypothetical protein